MPNPWMPGLQHHPGAGAGYPKGQNQMWMVVDHNTGGTNSYQICKDGRPGYGTSLCQILLPKVGVPWQFCEIDSICYHAGSKVYGDYNPKGPGLEEERRPGEGLSADQVFWTGNINRWLNEEWGVPNIHYWGPQFPWHQANFHGHVNHSDIHPNPDGLTQAEWDAITVPSTPIEEDDMYFMTNPANRSEWWCVSGNCKRKMPTSEVNAMKYVGKKAFDADTTWFNSIYGPPVNSGDLTNIAGAVWNAASRTLT